MKSAQRTPIIVLATIIVVIVGAWAVWNVTRQLGPLAPTNFEQCQAAGYPVMESYPRQCATPDGKRFVENVQNQNTQPNSNTPTDSQSDVRLTSPRSGSTVTSPLQVTGEARGRWYFEASFPVRLEDESGKVIAQTFAQAQSDWMQEGFVPFKRTVAFSVTATTSAYLVLSKDNPSGLPENAAEVRYPVTLVPASSAQETTEVRVYFATRDTGQAPDFDCGDVSAARRTVPRTPTIAKTAITELLKGPNEQEKNQGFTTAIPSGVDLVSVTINAGLARVDLSSELQAGVGGSCRVTTIRAQIEQTLKQFPSVQRVEIAIDGSTDEVLQP